MVPSAAPPPGGGLGWAEFADAVWLAAVVTGGGGPSPAAPPEDTGTAPERAPDAPGDGPDRPRDTPGQSPPHPPPAPPRHIPHRPPIPVGLAPIDESSAITVAALPGSRSIARELKPFKRRVLSPTETEPDEDATAERAADEGLWLPEMRPARTRWLGVALIVDDSPSMAVWRPTVAALRQLLERHGSFRDVREFILSPGGGGGPDGPGPGTGPRVSRPGTGPRSPAELLDPSGRQLFLVVTDGIGELWADPRTGRLLRLWASSGPMAIVNLYPQGYWHRTALSPRRARLYAPRPVVPNDRLRVEYPDELRNPFDRPVESRSLAIPVLELSPRWIRWWTRLVTDPQGWVDGMVHAVDPGPPVEGPPAGPPAAASPREAVVRFRSSASPLAFRLATYLAAAPLDLPLVRKVQRVVLPDSAPFHLAEVITSDLVRRAGGPGRSLEFADGVREALLACTTRDEAAQVVRAVAANHSRPATFALMRAIEAPDQSPDPPVTAETLPMARVELAVLTALSGPYAGRADRLRRSIATVEGGLAGPGPLAMLDLPPEPERTNESPADPGVDQNGGEMPTPRESDMPAENVPGDRPEPPPRVGHELGPIDPWLLGGEDPVPLEESLLNQPDEPFVEEQNEETEAKVWGNVPPRNPVFIGRRELLAQLEERLLIQSVAAVLPQALHGMGGVGKSQIAMEYAYRHRADYDVVWWVPSEQPAQILASLVELGKRLGLDVDMEANAAVLQVQKALRAGTPYANWLLVFDNAETLDTVQRYFPEASTGKVLVTSRNPDWSEVVQTLVVDVFTRPESIRLLQRRNPSLSAQHADQLADSLGDLPLAIEHASAWLATTGMDVREYLALLDQKRAELEALVHAPGYEMPVAAAANVALDRLGVENPAALQLLQVCSFFAPEPIKRDLFTGLRTTPIAAELDATLQSPSQVNQAIRDMQRYVLVRVDHLADTIQLHRLVKTVLQGRMPPEQRSTMEHAAHMLLANGRPGAPGDATHWPQYQSLASHLIASDAIDCQDDSTRELVLNLIEFYYYWGDYRSCRELAQRVVERWRTMLGPDHGQTLRAAKWLGFVWWVLGDFVDAAALNADSLERCRRILGLDDEGTIDAMALVAADLRAAGRFAEARELDLDALPRARRRFGVDDPATFKAALSLGVSLRLTGDFRAARRLDGDTYARRLAILGANDPETLRILNNLTLDERECGEYLKAHRLAERLYQRYLDLLGVEHPQTVAVARNLAVACRRAGDHQSAYKLSEDTMKRLSERFGPTYPDAMAASLNFAVDVREADDLPRARALAAETAERYRATLGPQHPYTLYARTNLGIVLRLLGRAEESHAHNLEAWQTLEQLLGPHHMLTLTCAINLASDRAVLGDQQGAHDLDAQTLQRCREVLGSDHPTTLACALNLALDLSALGSQDEGTALFDQTLASYVRVLGADHPAITAATSRVRANCDVDPMPF